MSAQPILTHQEVEWAAVVAAALRTARQDAIAECRQILKVHSASGLGEVERLMAEAAGRA